jgi:hypothetical protein
LTGAGLVVGYALMNGAEASVVGDLLMMAAVVVCGLGMPKGASFANIGRVAGDQLGIACSVAVHAAADYRQFSST